MKMKECNSLFYFFRYVTTEDNDELDFDTQTDCFKENIKLLNKNLEENKYLIGKV